MTRAGWEQMLQGWDKADGVRGAQKALEMMPLSFAMGPKQMLGLEAKQLSLQ